MIEFRNVSFSYPQQPNEWILKQINLTINKGEFVTIIGHNGSGKSTLAKHMNGLLLPVQGEVMVDGFSTADRESIWEIRRRVGMVFQNPDNQFVAPTVLDDVAFGLENLGVPREEMAGRIESALRQVSMWEYRDREPHRLSGGQKQRVAIAGILAMRPDVIVFDESTAMLDPAGRKEVMQTARLLKEKGIAVVNITHYLEESLFSDRILVMSQGEIVLQGTPREVFQEISYLKQLRLDVPLSVELANRLRKRGMPIPDEIWEMDPLVECLWNLL